MQPKKHNPALKDFNTLALEHFEKLFTSIPGFREKMYLYISTFSDSGTLTL
jgi:hypothetical protein